MQPAFDVGQGIRRYPKVGGVSFVLVVGTASGTMDGTTDAVRDRLTSVREVRITETNPGDADPNNDGVRDGDEDDD